MTTSEKNLSILLVTFLKQEVSNNTKQNNKNMKQEFKCHSIGKNSSNL